MLQIKICGITNHEDALAAVEYGADALGFVFYPLSPRAITPDRAREIISQLPPFVATVGVFVDEDKMGLERVVTETGIDIIQLHGSEPPDYCDNLKRRVIKAIRVKELIDLEPLKHYRVSAFLLDTYSPEAVGGTGRIFNWEIAIEAKNFGNIILAGGLNPENIEDAIKIVQPYGVDVASGVEGNEKGRKDHKKVRLFIERARMASRSVI